MVLLFKEPHLAAGPALLSVDADDALVRKKQAGRK